MRAGGHQYQSPWQPNDEASSQDATEGEKKTATADVECRSRTRMTDVWVAVENAYQKRLIEEHASSLRAVAQYHDGQLRNARAAVLRSN
jgi:hypothetical protein